MHCAVGNIVKDKVSNAAKLSLDNFKSELEKKINNVYRRGGNYAYTEKNGYHGDQYSTRSYGEFILAFDDLMEFVKDNSHKINNEKIVLKMLKMSREFKSLDIYEKITFDNYIKSIFLYAFTFTK